MSRFYTTLPTLNPAKLAPPPERTRVRTEVPPRIESHAMRLAIAAHWSLMCWRHNVSSYF